MQAVTIFFPIYEHYTSNRLSKVTLDALQAWESKKTWGSTTFGSGGSSTSQHRSTSDKSTGTSDSKRYKIYSMEALEKAIAANPAPLLQFAATKDFTAENIIFLIAVRDWRLECAAQQQSRSMMVSRAAEIYANSVSEALAEFPINIEWPIKSRLDAIFGSAVSNNSPRSAHFNDAVPFSDLGMTTRPLKSPQSAFTQIKESEPEDFDETVFDAAEQSIKYLVLTNTWRKYVGDPRSPHTSELTLI